MADPTTTQALKSKEYETIYILRGDVDADTAEKVQARISEVVARESGKLTKVEAWGRRKLAYPVAKQKKGVYVFVKYVGQGGLVQEVERNLKLQDSVLKFQTVLTQHDVNVGEITIDPEEVKMARLDLPVEEEEKESRERSLGLLDTGNDGPRSRSYDREDREEFTAEGSGGPASTAAADDDSPNSDKPAADKSEKEVPAAAPSASSKDGDK
jgi:small subunit ribosomal protein S6